MQITTITECRALSCLEVAGWCTVEFGSSETIILVHGSPGHERAWWRVAERLMQHHRVLMSAMTPLSGDKHN
jgi:hypothetical protein